MSAEALKTSIAGPVDNGRVTQGQENGPLGRMGEIVLKRDVIPQNISAHYNILCTRTSSHPISTCLMKGFALTCFCPNKYLLALPQNSFPLSSGLLTTTKRYSNLPCALSLVFCSNYLSNTIEQGSSIHLEKIFSSVIDLGLTGH